MKTSATIKTQSKSSSKSSNSAIAVLPTPTTSPESAEAANEKAMSVTEWLEYHVDKGTSLANTIKDDLSAVINRQVTPFKLKFNPDSVTHARRTKDVVDEFHHILTRAISSLKKLDKSMMEEFNAACPTGSSTIKHIMCNNNNEGEEGNKQESSEGNDDDDDKEVEDESNLNEAVKLTTSSKNKKSSGSGAGKRIPFEEQNESKSSKGSRRSDEGSEKSKRSTTTIQITKGSIAVSTSKADTTTSYSSSENEEPSSTVGPEDSIDNDSNKSGSGRESPAAEGLDDTVIMLDGAIDDAMPGSKDDDEGLFPVDKDPLALDDGNEEELEDLSQSLLVDDGATIALAPYDIDAPSPTGTVLLTRGGGESATNVIENEIGRNDAPGNGNEKEIEDAAVESDHSNTSRPPSPCETVYHPVNNQRKPGPLSRRSIKKDPSDLPEYVNISSPVSPSGTVIVPRANSSKQKTSSKHVKTEKSQDKEDIDDDLMDVDDFMPPTPAADPTSETLNEITEDIDEAAASLSSDKRSKASKEKDNVAKSHSDNEKSGTNVEDVFASLERKKNKSAASTDENGKETATAKSKSSKSKSESDKSKKPLSKEEAAARKGALADSSDDEEEDKKKKSRRPAPSKTAKEDVAYSQDTDPKLKELEPKVELNRVSSTILQALKENKVVHLPSGRNTSGRSTDADSDGSIALLDKELRNLVNFNPLRQTNRSKSLSPKKKVLKKKRGSGSQKSNNNELTSDEESFSAPVVKGGGTVNLNASLDCSDLEDLDGDDCKAQKSADEKDDSPNTKKVEKRQGAKDKKTYKTVDIELSDDDEDEERRRALSDSSGDEDFKKPSKKKSAGTDSEDSDVPPTRRNHRPNIKIKSKKQLMSNSEEGDASASVNDVSDDEDSDSDFKPSKKSTGKSKRKNVSSDEDQQKKKKRKRIKVEKDSDDESVSSTNKAADSNDSDIQEVEHIPASQGRKNIKKIMSDKKLLKTTKEAEREEEERKQRILEKQKLFNGIMQEQAVQNGDGTHSRLILEFDPETKKPLIEVDESIVKKLKPHQVNGVKFMYTACFESAEMIKKGKGGGCILAHCMGLGKTLQTVAFTQTMLSHHEITGVKTVLIVCPLNTVTNWLKEYKNWCGDLETKDKPLLHSLWDYKKDTERVDAMKTWKRRGGVGIIHYDMFRGMVNKAQGTQKNTKGLRASYKEAIKDTLLDPGPDLVVCDEGHLLKNHKSKLTVALSQMKTIRRVVLTGTPLQNNLVEYHTMVDFVKPNLLGTLKEFTNRFVNPIKNGQHKDSNERDVKVMKRRAHVLHCKLDACVQRLDFSVLTPYLPPKYEYCIIIKLSEKQKELYRRYLDTKVSTDAVERGRRILQHYAVLIKLVAHPIVLTMKKNIVDSEDEEGSLKDFVVSDDDDETSSPDSDVECLDNTNSKPSKRKTRSAKLDPTNEESNSSTSSGVKEKLGNEWYSSVFQSKEEMYDVNLSGKIVVLQEILKTCETIEDRVLVFSQYLTSLDIIEEFLAEWDEAAQKEDKTEKTFPMTNAPALGRWRKGIEYFRIDGSTKSDDRQKHCDTFNKKSAGRAKLFLISTKAGGLGINLFGANRVVIFDASWNPSNDMQSIFRVYRFGQSKPCYIYRLVAQATMEEKIYNRQVVKLSLSSRVVDEHQVERHFKFDDINEMFRFNPDEKTERPTPPVPKDRLLADLLISHKDWIDSYFEHDTLLTNKVDEELTEEERKQAWEEYQFENERRAQPMQFNTQVPTYDSAMVNYVTGVLQRKFVAATPLEISQSTTNVVQKFMEWTQLVQRKKQEERATVNAGMVYSAPQLDADIQTLQAYCSSAVGKDGMGELVKLYNENTRRQQEAIQRQQQHQQAMARARANASASAYQASINSAVNQVINQSYRYPTSSYPRPGGPNILNRNNIPNVGQMFAGVNLNNLLSNGPGTSSGLNRNRTVNGNAPSSTPARNFTESFDVD